MKTIALAACLCIGLGPAAAFAYDWSLNTTQSETVELNDNQFLRTPSAGTVGSYSTITANAEAHTSTSKIDFDADGTYKKYWGPGADGVQSEYSNYGFKGRYEVKEKNNFDREFIETSWRQQSAALALLNDLGVATSANGFLDRLTVTGGLDRSLTALDSISLLATSIRTSYEPSSGGIPFTDTLGRGVWQHKLTSTASISATSEAELLEFGNAFSTRVQIYRNQLGIDANLSRLLSFHGNAGLAYLATDGGVSTTSPFAVSNVNTDWIGEAVLTYKMYQDTIINLSASQSVGPSIVGSLIKRDNLTANLNYTINSSSTLMFSANATRQISTTTTDYASASIGYGYRFTRELTAQVNYRYLHRFNSTGGSSTIDPITGTPTVSGTGPANSNSLMLVISRNFAVLPRGN